MATRPFWAEIKNLRTCYCAPYKFVSFGPTNTIVSDLERYDIGLPEYVEIMKIFEIGNLSLGTLFKYGA